MNNPAIDPLDENDVKTVSVSVEQAAADQHADKYNDPRAQITRRGILIGVIVVLIGIAGSLGSIYARKTQLEESTRFWGEETITALQLGERIELLPVGGSDFRPVELTATPGLGHLRRALLDERHYEWDSETDRPALEYCGNAKVGEDEDEFTECVRLRLTDPTGGRFETIEIDIDLGEGWIGPSDGSRRVKATSYVQPKLRNYFKTIVNVEQLRYDMREE
ncbi:MAG: hypothetical protein AAGG48_31895 [Planctomycetota bacterium]